ncbi:interleukin-1 receptor type 1-like [Pelodytes ibericus]
MGVGGVEDEEGQGDRQVQRGTPMDREERPEGRGVREGTSTRSVQAAVTSRTTAHGTASEEEESRLMEISSEEEAEDNHSAEKQTFALNIETEDGTPVKTAGDQDTKITKELKATQQKGKAKGVVRRAEGNGMMSSKPHSFASKAAPAPARSDDTKHHIADALNHHYVQEAWAVRTEMMLLVSLGGGGLAPPPRHQSATIGPAPPKGDVGHGLGRLFNRGACGEDSLSSLDLSQCCLCTPVQSDDSELHDTSWVCLFTKDFSMSFILCTFLLSLTYLASNKAEPCQDEGEEFERTYVSNGQPVYMTCPLISLSSDINLTTVWYTTNPQKQISFDTQSRIHQNEDFLKFIPARLEDSQYYMCVLRNSTYCVQKLVKLDVFEFNQGLCYNTEALYPYRNFIAPTVQVVCPDLYYYVDAQNINLKWFKECLPLDTTSNKYIALGLSLTIKSLTQQDEGIYTCEALFYHNGTSYTISRTADVILKAMPQTSGPAIIYPTNNILSVELGSPVTVTCEVQFKKEISALNFLYWTYNNTLIEYYDGFNERVKVGDMYTTPPSDDYRMRFLDLNFTKVEEEDYNKKFFCEINSASVPSAYFMFKRPDPNFQSFLIAFFVALVFVIIICLLAFKMFKVDLVLFYRSTCFAKTNLKDGKLYDAYIMYPKNSKGNSAYSMDLFVLKILPEVLERQCTYRLFIFGRDDIPGQAVTDLIEEAISQSRRLIIILGNTSSEHRLGNDFEQQIAMYDALIRNKTRVILVELEKIADYSNMPESIKYVKQKQGVVRWKGEFTEATLSPRTTFWKKLRYRMPPEQHQHLTELNHISSESHIRFWHWCPNVLGNLEGQGGNPFPLIPSGGCDEQQDAATGTSDIPVQRDGQTEEESSFDSISEIALGESWRANTLAQ